MHNVVIPGYEYRGFDGACHIFERQIMVTSKGRRHVVNQLNPLNKLLVRLNVHDLEIIVRLNRVALVELVLVALIALLLIYWRPNFVKEFGITFFVLLPIIFLITYSIMKGKLKKIAPAIEKAISSK